MQCSAEGLAWPFKDAEGSTHQGWRKHYQGSKYCQGTSSPDIVNNELVFNDANGKIVFLVIHNAYK